VTVRLVSADALTGGITLEMLAAEPLPGGTGEFTGQTSKRQAFKGGEHKGPHQSRKNQGRPKNLRLGKNGPGSGKKGKKPANKGKKST
jgi:hypothetical protein